MIYDISPTAIVVFLIFVGFTLGLSFWLGRKAKSSEGYFAAHGQIPWFVNGVAFAGDYLSAASFLGICGMIAFYGYDGFLYSIGFLAGWIVALFVVAEPMKKLGKFTFADALDAKFDSTGIKLAAGISTLVVSIFYLIPQMVGAGVLIQPLLGFPHWAGVLIVGAVVVTIVVTAGMVSTTYVQFLKGGLLVIFSAILTVLILDRGFNTETGFESRRIAKNKIADILEDGFEKLEDQGPWKDKVDKNGHPLYLRAKNAAGQIQVWKRYPENPSNPESFLLTMHECQLVEKRDGKTFVNGLPFGREEGQDSLKPIGSVARLPGDQTETGPLNPVSFFSTLQESDIRLWKKDDKFEGLKPGESIVVYYPEIVPGSRVLRPGEHPKFKGIRSDNWLDKLNFLSLMLALFCGTASLPHILIRYYTVKDAASARKSTIVGIASIGFFYVLTLYLGLGAMTSGQLDVSNSNMAAPLLAKSISSLLFAIISAIAFTTVLGTVSGLILASSGAVTHDLAVSVFKMNLDDDAKVRLAKIASVVVGVIAIVLGILFKGLNVGYLVGWAFSIAASANLPALVMLLFWKKTTKQGIIAAVLVGMISSLGWILLSQDTYKGVYGIDAKAIVPFSQPGLVTIPLGFLTLVVVSLITQNGSNKKEDSRAVQ